MIVVPIRVISKNVRYAIVSPFKGEELWSVRKEYLINELRFNSLNNQEALICCQEVLYAQLQDILTGLQNFDRWDYVGWGRDDGKEAGEYSPIFYRPAVWELLEKTPIWLSSTPDVPSQDPDAGSIRILTRAVFRHIATEQRIAVYCTHLDNASSAARQRAANQILQIAERDAERPILLAGDFNSETIQEAYQTIVESKKFIDASSANNLVRYGNTNTFTGFGPDDGPPTRIDYIFHSSSPAWHVLQYGVLVNRFDNGVANSDHRAVVVDLELRNN